MVNTSDNSVTFGRVVVALQPRPGSEYISLNERPEDKQHPTYFVSSRLVGKTDPDKPMAVQAAMNANPIPIRNTYIDVETPSNVQFTGASCGLAVFAALSDAIPNDTCVTGFVFEDGGGVKQELRIMEIDHVNSKIAPFLSTDVHVHCPSRLFIPFCCLRMLPLDVQERVYTMSDYVRGRDPTKFRIMAVGTVGDLVVLSRIAPPTHSKTHIKTRRLT